MATITATFFECGVRYERQTEDAGQKKVNELYIVDALTFTEAEERITKEMEPFVSGDFDVMTIKRTRYSEFINNAVFDDKFFKAKVIYITLDEKTAKVKRTPVFFLVQASDINTARKIVDDIHKSTALDYEIVTLDETKYLDVFVHDTKSKSNANK